MPDDKDQDIVKDELITFTSKEAKKADLDREIFRLVHVYREDENKVTTFVRLDWQARTIADL